jgi:hypothetical protein
MDADRAEFVASRNRNITQRGPLDESTIVGVVCAAEYVTDQGVGWPIVFEHRIDAVTTGHVREAGGPMQDLASINPDRHSAVM